MFRQFIPGDPFERGTAEGLRLAADPFAKEEFQVDGLFLVGVGDFFKQFAHGNGHAQFFTDFADEALLEGFVWFALAAGKFPQAA